MSSENSKKPRILVGCGIVAIAMNAVFLLAIAFLCWQLVNIAIRRDGARPVEIRPDRFYVVLFPKHDQTEMPVQRGVFLSLDELTNGTINVIIGGKEVSMDTKSFTAIPEEAREQSDIEELNREIKRWGEQTDWRRVEYFINRKGHGGETVVKLTLYTEKHGDRLEYLYRVTADGTVVPVWSLFYNRI